MTIPFRCPNCRAGIQTRDELAGKLVTCPKCKKLVTVPIAEEAAAVPIDREGEPQTEWEPVEATPRKSDSRASGNSGGSNGLFIVLGVVGGVVLLSCLGVGGCIFLGARGVSNAAREFDQSVERSRRESKALAEQADISRSESKALAEQVQRDLATGAGQRRERPLGIPLTQLLDEYFANEVAADLKYKGKWLTVQGQVHGIDKTSFTESIYVSLQSGGRNESLFCHFDDKLAGTVAQLRPGQSLTVVGKWNGKRTLKECEFVGEKTGSGAGELITTKSGLKYIDERDGTGDRAQAGHTVEVHYVGMLTNGKKFDSSVDRGKPVSFNLGAGQVIRGWDEGVAGMRVGGKRKLFIPYELAYGEQGQPPLIPPKSELIIDVELLKVSGTTGKPAAVDWSRVGTKATVGDVEVELFWAGVAAYDYQKFGMNERWRTTVVGFALTNKSSSIIHRFTGWGGRSKLVDEHGNSFGNISPDGGSFFGSPIPGFAPKFRSTPELERYSNMEWPAIITSNMPLHPGRSYGTCLLFEKMPETSKEIRLILSAEALEGTGELFLRLPRKQ